MSTETEDLMIRLMKQQVAQSEATLCALRALNDRLEAHLRERNRKRAAKPDQTAGDEER